MIRWTESQQKAITARGGDLLVSAAAGSGKTAVLTERIVSLVTDPDRPLDIDRLLVVTFSNAAAAEMKRRIAKRLHELLRENPGDKNLKRQILLLDHASVSTIHSFCFRLIRENAPALGLPGDLRLGDDQEMNLLRQRVAAELLDDEYEKGDPLFYQLTELLSGSKTDYKVQDSILALYDFIRNHPHYEKWAEDFLKRSLFTDFDSTPWCRILKDYAGEALDCCIGNLSHAAALTAGYDELTEKILPLLEGDLVMLEDLRTALRNESWDVCAEKSKALSFPRFKPVKSEEEKPMKEAIHALRDEAKKTAEKLPVKVFAMSGADAAADAAAQQPLIEKLFALVLDFDRRFSEAKLLKGKLDYSDLEHYALRLLGGSEAPTELAGTLSEQYAEILMDEYQDTNALQEEIFASIAAGGTPRFMVGDVKQSIYRFRAACPEIFLKKKETFAKYDGVHFPAVISLSDNFRTRREITGFVNELFTDLMNPTIGEMKYREEDALKPGFPYDYSTAVPVSVLKVPSLDLGRADSTELEAAAVADKISELLQEGFSVTENNEKRPAEPRDFCILLRYAKQKAGVFLKALQERGLSGRIEQKEGFLTAGEIVPVLSMLKILRNPMLDPEFAKATVSRLSGFTADDLAELRAADRKSMFRALESGSFGTREPFAAFLTDYRELRAMLQNAPYAEVLRELYRRTDYLKKMSVLPDGSRMTANLLLLTEYAADFERDRAPGEDFTEYLSRLLEYDYDLPAAALPGENAVSIMTVHKSKGLEFPVVFLSDLASDFHGEDHRTDIVFNRELGFACKLRDSNAMRQHETLPLLAIRAENERAELSEEMRVLYVAMTRAREKLFLTASGRTLPLNEERAERRRGGFTVWEMRKAGSFYDWLMPSFLNLLDKKDGTAEILFSKPSETEEKTADQSAQQEEAAPDDAILQKLRLNTAYRYPYQKETVTPRRISVSDLAERETGREFLMLRCPKAVEAKDLSPTELGTAIHKVMQFADLSFLAKDAAAEVSRLVNEGYLYKEEEKQIDISAISRFLTTELGRRVLQSGRVYREMRFMQEFTPEELAAVDPSLRIDSTTVLMGAADCVFTEDGHAVLIDY